MLEKTLESPLDCTENTLFNSKGNQPWIFTGRIDAEAEAPILWPPDVKSWSLEKMLMLGKMEGRRRRGWQRMRWLDGISLSKLWEIMKDREAWHASLGPWVLGPWVEKSWTKISTWTATSNKTKSNVIGGILFLVSLDGWCTSWGWIHFRGESNKADFGGFSQFGKQMRSENSSPRWGHSQPTTGGGSLNLDGGGPRSLAALKSIQCHSAEPPLIGTHCQKRQAHECITKAKSRKCAFPIDLLV